MFYQEKHPGEKSAHLFQTNKNNLLIINLLFRRQIESLTASGLSPPTWVSVLCIRGAHSAVATEKHLAVPTPVAGNKDTNREEFKNNCGQSITLEFQHRFHGKLHQELSNYL